MSLFEKLSLKLAHRMDPEKAHGYAVSALNKGMVAQPGAYESPRLRTNIAGLELAHPIGLAAGFDKNAEAMAPLLGSGFSFIEVGAATPAAQDGNPKPRLFRLPEDQASINRFGFNNDGMEAIAERLAARPKQGIVGLNLGANKTSQHRAIDYVQVLEACGDYIDFATVNVSSPNTEQLRKLQSKQALNALLDGVSQTRDNLARPIPIFLKIAPELEREEIAQIAQAAIHNRVDAIIATNTTTDRIDLRSADAAQKGGLSGQPLFEKSTRILASFAAELESALPLIGVGGIGSAQQALAKIEAGATALQLYTALIYNGFSLTNKIAKGLDNLLAERGYDHISQAVGTRTVEYL